MRPYGEQKQVLLRIELLGCYSVEVLSITHLDAVLRSNNCNRICFIICNSNIGHIGDVDKMTVSHTAIDGSSSGGISEFVSLGKTRIVSVHSA